tara:strand:- start:1050 stop:1298 length:249 start_codon:yes stop_codon:yes gene_type:complete
MQPFDTKIKYKDGSSVDKVHVMYIDRDSKLCDGCDKEKENVASIRMAWGDVACICHDCIMDLSRAWDEPRTLLTEFMDIYEK